MRFIKMLGLVAVVAIAATALFGAGPASAVTFCKESKEVCPEAQRYAAGSVFKFHSNKVVLKGASISVTCESNVEAKLDEVSGNPLKVEVPSITYTGCEPCSGVTATGLPDTGLSYWAILWILFLVHELKSGSPGLTLKGCPLGVECKFQVAENEEKPASAVLRIEGGKPASLKTGGEKTNVVKLNLTGGSEAICGKTATWEGTYSQTSPETGIWGSKEP